MLKDAIENSNTLNEKGDYLYFLYYGCPRDPLTPHTLYCQFDGLEALKFFVAYGYCVNYGDKSKMFSNSNFDHSEYKPRSYSLCFDPDKVEIYDEETVQKYGLQKLVEETGEKDVIVAKYPKDMIGLKKNPDKLMPALYSYMNRSHFINLKRAYELKENYERKLSGKGKLSAKDLNINGRVQKYEKEGNGNYFGSICPPFIYAVQLSKYGKLIYNPFYGDVFNDTNIGLYTYSSEQMEYLKENNQLEQVQESYETIKTYTQWAKSQNEDLVHYGHEMQKFMTKIYLDFLDRVKKYNWDIFYQKYNIEKYERWNDIQKQIIEQINEYKKQGLVENIDSLPEEELIQRGYEVY